MKQRTKRILILLGDAAIVALIIFAGWVVFH